MADEKKAKRTPEKDTETPPHGDALIERNMERIAEANLPKANEANEANEANREDARPGTNT